MASLFTDISLMCETVTKTVSLGLRQFPKGKYPHYCL